ncbi:MAG: hypothetical protein QM667_08735 [Asticcacaulis sp.]
MRGVVLFLMLGVMATPAAAAEGLCDLQAEGVSFRQFAKEGNDTIKTLEVPPGYNGVRVEGRFAAFRAYDYYLPLFLLRFRSSALPQFNLRFRMRFGDEAIIAQTVLATTADRPPPEGRAEIGFDYRGRPRQPFRSDVFWNDDGRFTVKIYTSDKGFDGPYVSQTRVATVPNRVDFGTSTADIEIADVRFGKVCK